MQFLLKNPALTLRKLALATGVALSSAAAIQAQNSTPENPALALDPYLVTADADALSAARLRSEALNSQLVTTSGDLLRFQNFSIGDALSRVPGIYVDGRRGRDVSLRGAGKEYTQVLVDGRRLADSSRDRSLQVDRIPAQFLERVEVNRSSLASFESQGVAGTVNLVFKRAPDKFSGYLSAITGYLEGTGAQDSITLGLGDRRGDFGYLINTSAQQRYTVEDSVTTNYNAAGTLTGSNLSPQLRRNRELTAAPRVTWFVDERTRIEYDLDYLFGRQSRFQDSRTINLAGVRTENTTEYRVRERESDSHRLALVHTTAAGGELSAAINYQDGREDTERLSHRFNAAGVQNRIETRSQQIGFDELASQVRWRSPAGASRWEAGAEYSATTRGESQTRTRDGTDRSAAGDNYDVDEDRAAAYVQHSLRFATDHLLTTGLRLEYDSRDIVDGLKVKNAHDRTDLNPSANYVWSIDPRTQLRAGVARTLRRPSIDTLATSYDNSPGGTLTSPDTAGNPSLVPETAWGLDIGIERTFASNRGLVALNLFDREIANRIENLTQLENTTLYGNRYVNRAQNVGKARLYGLETEVRVPATFLGLPNLVVYGNGSWLRSRYTEKSTAARYAFASQPRLMATVGADLFLPALHSRVGFNANRIFNYTVIAPNGGGTTSRTAYGKLDTLDAYYTWQISNRWQFNLSGLNLLASTGKRHVTSYTAANAAQSSSTVREPNPRSGYAGLAYSW